MFPGLDVDEHLQTFTEVDHLLELGITKKVLLFFFEHLKKSELKKDVELRFRNLEFPRRWGRPKVNFTGTLPHPISDMRKISIITPYLFEGIVPESCLKVLLQLISLKNFLYTCPPNDSSVKQVSSLFVFFFVFVLFGYNKSNKTIFLQRCKSLDRVGFNLWQKTNK